MASAERSRIRRGRGTRQRPVRGIAKTYTWRYKLQCRKRDTTVEARDATLDPIFDAHAAAGESSIGLAELGAKLVGSVAPQQPMPFVETLSGVRMSHAGGFFMAAISAAVAHHRARTAALTRAIRNGERPPDDPDLIDARQNLTALQLEEYVRKVLATAP